jgi:hypothetical protein
LKAPPKNITKTVQPFQENLLWGILDRKFFEHFNAVYLILKNRRLFSKISIVNWAIDTATIRQGRPHPQKDQNARVLEQLMLLLLL